MWVALRVRVARSKWFKRSNVRTAVGFALGFAGGWAARGVATSPEIGVELAGALMQARRKLGHWAALERERLEDLLAEARARVGSGEVRR
jgi:hypothetical protein